MLCHSAACRPFNYASCGNKLICEEGYSRVQSTSGQISAFQEGYRAGTTKQHLSAVHLPKLYVKAVPVPVQRAQSHCVCCNVKHLQIPGGVRRAVLLMHRRKSVYQRLCLDLQPVAFVSPLPYVAHMRGRPLLYLHQCRDLAV